VELGATGSVRWGAGAWERGLRNKGFSALFAVLREWLTRRLGFRTFIGF